MVGIVGMHGFRTDQWVLLPSVVWQLVLTPLKFSTIAFFLAAGFLLGNRLETLEPMHYLSRRLRRVFLPWLVWTVLFSFLLLVSSIGHHKISGDLTPALLSAFAEKLFISVTGTAFWFVPNLFVGLTLLLMLRRHLDSLWLGFGLLAIDLFYVVNIYCRWIPSRHSQAVFGFVFYLWLGRYASRHYERVQDWLRRTSMGVLIPAVLLLGIFAFAESRILVHTEAIDSANTLRLTNQAYSIAVVLMIMKIRRVTWPHFMNVRRYTFGIYLSHTVMLDGILSCLWRYSPATFLVALRQSVSVTLLTEIIVTCLVYFLCVGITAVLAETPHLQWVVGCNPRSRAAKKVSWSTI